jgi:hypothetical protein
LRAFVARAGCAGLALAADFLAAGFFASDVFVTAFIL